MEEFASLFSLFILIGKSIEARFYSKVPATLPWIFGARSGAEWSPVAPSCISPSINPSKPQSAEGTHRLEVGWHRAPKSRRCHRGRDACLAQLGCRVAVLKSTALGNGWALLRGERISCTGEVDQAKQRAWWMRYPWADQTSASPWAIWRKWPSKSRLWIVSVGLLPSSLHCSPSMDTPKASDPIARGQLTLLLIWASSPAKDMLTEKAIPGPHFLSLYGNSSVQGGWGQRNPHCFKQIWSQMHQGRKEKLNYSCSIPAPYVKHSLLMLPIPPTSLPKLDEKQIHYLKDICLKFPFCALAIWDLQLSLPILLVIAPTTANNAFIKQNLLIYLFVSLYYFYYLGIK